MRKRIVFLLILLLPGLLGLPSAAAARDSISFIRDAEVEGTIRAFSAPLFAAAGLNPDDVRIYLVNDRSLNAFVAGGMNMFVHTGLLTAAENPGEVIGVIAHETGHIAGGHISRTQEALGNIGAATILGMVLGTAAAVAGRADVGAALMQGGQQMGVANFLSYSRAQEQAADQAGVSLLEATGQSSAGLLSFMEKLGDQELLSTRQQNPYARTHPLSHDRVAFLRDHVAKSSLSDTPPSPEQFEMHRRMQAKLFAFLDPPARVERRYKADDPSIEARYARAVVAHRRAKVDEAMTIMSGLLAERPDDPYFHELAGQILFEHGRVGEALTYYRHAARLLPKSPLVLQDLGRALIAADDPAMLAEATEVLRTSLRLDPGNAFGWRQLAIAYGRQEQMALSALALAEEAYLQGEWSNALFQAGKVEQSFPPGSREWLRAQDIRSQAERMMSQSDGPFWKR